MLPSPFIMACGGSTSDLCFAFEILPSLEIIHFFPSSLTNTCYQAISLLGLAWVVTFALQDRIASRQNSLKTPKNDYKTAWEIVSNQRNPFSWSLDFLLQGLALFSLHIPNHPIAPLLQAPIMDWLKQAAPLAGSWALLSQQHRGFIRIKTQNIWSSFLFFPSICLENCISPGNSPL